ncbi:MAG: polyketide synthase, partial [Proteobacteria bacterium]|nr:polyketide synthase [Pseudomonadota bacterium]
MTHKSPIAVVGMAGLFPGARDLDTFWHNIIHKISAAGEIPDSRWIPDLYQTHGPRAHPDKAYSTRACLLDDYRIKPGDVNLDADLLAQLDPLHHLVLGAGKAALANCNLSSIKNDRIGISLAAIALPTSSANLMTCAILENAFEEKLFNTSLDKTALTPNQCAGGRVTGYPASLLAKAFDIRGTAFTLDAACASSIYAVKIACDELWANEADAMIAGGVSRPDNIFTQVGFSQLRALSPSGRCAAFDESADGLVVGEGAGLLVLKRLEDALAHGDFIYGLVAGIGLSNDMSGNLLAPDKEGQIRAMKSAYEVAGWQPTDVDFIECHGAGTPVGDLVELQS